MRYERKGVQQLARWLWGVLLGAEDHKYKLLSDGGGAVDMLTRILIRLLLLTGSQRNETRGGSNMTRPTTFIQQHSETGSLSLSCSCSSLTSVWLPVVGLTVKWLFKVQHDQASGIKAFILNSAREFFFFCLSFFFKDRAVEHFVFLVLNRTLKSSHSFQAFWLRKTGLFWLLDDSKEWKWMWFLGQTDRCTIEKEEWLMGMC